MPKFKMAEVAQTTPACGQWLSMVVVCVSFKIRCILMEQC